MARKLVLALASLCITLLALEGLLRVLPPEPDGFGHTRAALRWRERHWSPINRQGFRDVDHDAAALRATRRLVVLGDSLAAGEGIADYRDRFASRLADALGEPWSVVVLARPGWNTGHQAEALEAFPHAPHQIVLAYYLNDIEGAAAEHGRRFELDLAVHPPWLAAWVEGSDLASFVYWRLRRSRIWSTGRDYAAFVYASFEDEDVWATHREELRRILRGARRVGAVPVVVLFPHLFDLEGSTAPIGRVRRFLAEEDVAVLDVTDLIAADGRDPREFFAGPVDPHPGPVLHREVADALLPYVVR